MSDHDPAVVAAAMSAMEKYTGVVPGYRRAHAHGHGFVGYFEATGAVAAHDGGRAPAGRPDRGGRAPVQRRREPIRRGPSVPRRGATLGLGVEFALPSGGRATWGAPNLTAFPASAPEEFVAVTPAQRRNARGRRNPLRLLAFVVRHRRTVPGLRALVSHPPIRSFAAADFHGLHAYYLVDAEGRRQAFRYHWISTMAGPRTVTEEEAALWPPQFLVEEMRQRVARGTGRLGADLRARRRTATRPTINCSPGRRRARRSTPARSR